MNLWGWLARKLRPEEGWLVFTLLMLTVLCLPAVILEAEWVPRDEGLLPLACAALIVGRWLALDEQADPLARWLVGGALGLVGALAVASHALPFAPGGGAATFDFAQRWQIWLDTARTGGVSQDTDVFLLYVALLCWTVVVLAAWAFYRRRNSLLALSLIALSSAVSVFYSDKGAAWLAVELGCGVLLVAFSHLLHAQSAWEAEGVDYATDLAYEMWIVSGLLALSVTVLSFSGLELNAEQFTEWFWDTFRAPRHRTEETMERLFSGVTDPAGRIVVEWGTETGGSSYLPREYTVSGPPPQFKQVMMRVGTDEPPPPPELPYQAGRPPEMVEAPAHYWMGGSYDFYTGRGWTMSVAAREPATRELASLTPPAYREVTQHYELTAPHGDTLYALYSPVRVSETVEAIWRAPGDLVGIAGRIMSYTVVSRLPTPTAGDLRAASTVYPEEIRAHYLQLPPTVPQRVLDLAQQVVEGGSSVYDKARLLERYLRTYPYSLDVDAVPEEHEVADYFLFEAREGFCEYYATAFVVMARAVGIPARLAMGYVGGEYDYTQEVYRVYHTDGHAWPEVYFPGWGWIGFEPTASEMVTEFPEEGTAPLPVDTLPAPPRTPARLVRYRWRTALLGLAGLGAGIWLEILLRRRRLRRTQFVYTIPLVWNWVRQSGARLGLPTDPALTPHEYAARLAAEVHRRAERTRRLRNRWLGMAAQVTRALNRLTSLYTLQVYSAPGATVKERTARELWGELRGPLRWFRWLGWVQRIGYIARPASPRGDLTAR